MTRPGPAPIARAAATNSCSRSDSTLPRMIRATAIQPSSDRHQHHVEDAVAQHPGAHHHHHQCRQREQRVGQPHQRCVDGTAHVARDHADQRPAEGGQQRHRHADGEGDPGRRTASGSACPGPGCQYPAGSRDPDRRAHRWRACGPGDTAPAARRRPSPAQSPRAPPPTQVRRADGRIGARRRSPAVRRWGSQRLPRRILGSSTP